MEEGGRFHQVGGKPVRLARHRRAAHHLREGGQLAQQRALLGGLDGDRPTGRLESPLRGEAQDGGDAGVRVLDVVGRVLVVLLLREVEIEVEMSAGRPEQEEELGASRANELAHGSGFVTAEIIHDHDVAGTKRGDEDLFDIGPEALPSSGRSRSLAATISASRNERSSRPPNNRP